VPTDPESREVLLHLTPRAGCILSQGERARRCQGRRSGGFFGGTASAGAAAVPSGAAGAPDAALSAGSSAAAGPAPSAAGVSGAASVTAGAAAPPCDASAGVSA